MRVVSYVQGCSKQYAGILAKCHVLCGIVKLCLIGKPSKIMFPKVFKCRRKLHDLDKKRKKPGHKILHIFVCVCMCIFLCICIHIYIYTKHNMIVY